jgi:hypothetical protein
LNPKILPGVLCSLPTSAFCPGPRRASPLPSLARGGPPRASAPETAELWSRAQAPEPLVPNVEQTAGEFSVDCRQDTRLEMLAKGIQQICVDRWHTRSPPSLRMYAHHKNTQVVGSLGADEHKPSPQHSAIITAQWPTGSGAGACPPSRHAHNGTRSRRHMPSPPHTHGHRRALAVSGTSQRPSNRRVDGWPSVGWEPPTGLMLIWNLFGTPLGAWLAVQESNPKPGHWRGGVPGNVLEPTPSARAFHTHRWPAQELAIGLCD